MAELSSSGRKNTPVRVARAYCPEPIKTQAEEIRARLAVIESMQPLRVREPVIFRAKEKS